MTQEEIAEYCLAKRGAYADHPFGPDVLIIKVQKRIFAQLFLLKGEPMATFNCDQATGASYRSIFPQTVTRGYHCPPNQQPYFNTLRLDGTVPDAMICEMIDHSYGRVVGRLKKSEKEALLTRRENDG